jgi:HTH-type transcriptional regulator / antitoxin HipB
MIKNEKQYWITRKHLINMQAGIDKIQSHEKPIPPKEELILVSLNVMKQQLENEISAYTHLRSGPLSTFSERSIDKLPELLIEFKINSGMTQKEFAKKIGMKEQQLQRYEAENFESISLRNLLKILHAIGLEITVKGKVKSN